MEKINSTTEQVILEAAELEFLEKGFSSARTTEIAKRAGVNHAMIHYYFRTKENLFNMVFDKKIGILSGSFTTAFDQDLDFFDKLKVFGEAHFDFLASNPKLLSFVYTEVISNESRKALLIEKVRPRLLNVFSMLTIAIEEAVNKKIIRAVKPLDLMLNVVSLNIVTFLAMPIMEAAVFESSEEIQEFLKERKASNIEFLIRGLRLN